MTRQSADAPSDYASKDRWGPADWVLTALYTGLIVFLLPRHVIARSDDFAYLEATVQAIRGHILQPSDWYEATNFLFSSVTALTYWVTGNFYLATYGVLTAFTVGTFVLLNRLLIQIGACRPYLRRMLVFTMVLMPVYLHRSVDFIGVMPLLFFFVAALWFYFRRNWAAFFIATAAGFLVRDNALLLLALPAGTIIWTFVANRPEGWTLARRLAPGFIFVLMLLAAERMFIPAGWMARQVGSGGFPPFLSFLARVVTGLNVCFASLLLFRAIAGVQASTPRTQYAGICYALLLTAGSLILAHHTGGITLYTPLPLGIGQLHINDYAMAALGVLAILLALQTSAAIAWQSPYVMVQILAILAISTRSSWADYYFLELILLSLVQAVSEIRERSQTRLAQQLAIAFLSSMLVLEGGYLVFYKRNVDEAELSIATLEPLYRNHSLSPQAVVNPPWGYAGWYFLQPYIHADNKPRNGFLFANAFLEGNVFLIFSTRKASTERADCEIIQAGSASLLGVPEYFTLSRCGQAHVFPVSLPPNRFFPLNNSEWSSYIEDPAAAVRTVERKNRL